MDATLLPLLVGSVLLSGYFLVVGQGALPMGVSIAMGQERLLFIGGLLLLLLAVRKDVLSVWPGGAPRDS